MVILSASDITKAFGVDTILSGLSFHCEKGDRIGIVGDNGAGKTTLLSILAGESTPDSGTLYRAAGATVGYLRQRDNFDSGNTVHGEMLALFSHLLAMEERMAALSHAIAEHSAAGRNADDLLHEFDSLSETFADRGGYRFRGEIDGILTSMAFPRDMYDKPISTLSGGERTRLALASLLLQKPEILLLDEPTNHLDIGTLKWLEGFLASYPGTVLVVSHDRYFLDQIVTRIFEIERRVLTVYEGDYSAYADQKRQREEALLKSFENQQKEIHRQEEMIRRFRQHGTEKLAKRARSREKRLDHITPLERPESKGGPLRLRFREKYPSGTDVLTCEGLSKSFGAGPTTRHLFRQVDLSVKRGERICMVGQNGIGKTTLLKILLGDSVPDSGRVKVGHNVVFGYYDQEQQLLAGDKTVIDEVWDSHRLYSEGELRSLLGRFLFRGDEVFKTVRDLSGGEKARLSLLKLMLSGANTLVMDEPTNHLDIRSKEVFEDALLSYPGTMLLVSHDRYLLNKIPTRIVELTGDGLASYLGGYDYYMEKKASIGSGRQHLSDLSKAASAAAPDRPAAAAKEQKQEERRQAKAADTARRRQERALAEREAEIHRLEGVLAELEKDLARDEVASDPLAVARCARSMEETQALLDAAFNEWMELQ